MKVQDPRTVPWPPAPESRRACVVEVSNPSIFAIWTSTAPYRHPCAGKRVCSGPLHGDLESSVKWSQRDTVLLLDHVRREKDLTPHVQSYLTFYVALPVASFERAS